MKTIAIILVSAFVACLCPGNRADCDALWGAPSKAIVPINTSIYLGCVEYKCIGNNTYSALGCPSIRCPDGIEPHTVHPSKPYPLCCPSVADCNKINATEKH
ncbi:uncharacterized protein LOC103577934 [Microplitis demolitor]|uniref:uncharacterized protein LOC103577934 n=1 Tax=Microplitis demolitor TaxID=69319 RepID=UPI0004CD0C36|nr:uncharacterized protein LOC103577934 [Microplitis demolitor]